MHEYDDMTLVREYALRRSEKAFETLVAQRVHLVYSAALRYTGDLDQAREITQAVFIILARKASRLPAKTHLVGWLLKSTRYVASVERRANARRRRSEKEAFMRDTLLQSAMPEDALWEEVAPMLDDALASLNESDRRALLLRFFEQQSLSQVGAALSLDEDAARKRVARALEKMRHYFAKRGLVKVTVAGLGTALAANAVQAAPAGLSASVTAAALHGAAAGGGAYWLASEAMKLMAWAKAGIAIGAAAVVLLAGGGAAILMAKQAETNSADDALYLDWYKNDRAKLDKAPPTVLVRPTHFAVQGGKWAASNQEKLIGVMAPWQALVEDAYQLPPPRMIFLDGKPINRQMYDFLDTTGDHARLRFQAEVKRQLQLDIQRVTLTTNALLLRVKVPGAARATTNGAAFRFLIIANMTSSRLGKPVVDQTGLSERYAVPFRNMPATPPASFDLTQPEGRAGYQALQDALGQALLEQLGVEMTPTNMPVEMLIIRKDRGGLE